ncbi:TPA: hypothetical protein ACGSUH_004951 [Escherichia coli]
MSKVTTIAFLLSLGMVGSASAAVSGAPIGTGNTAITQSLTSASCSVSFPNDVTLPAFSTATFNNTPVNGRIGDVVNVGDITFSGCNNNTVNVVVTSSNSTSGSGYLYPTFNGSAQGFIGYWITINNGPAKPNGTVDTLQNIQINSDTYTLPVAIQTIKMKNGSFGSTTAGDYSANITYTATYS